MPLKKNADAYKHCISPQHNPPNMMVYQPGCYEWKCPSCGHITAFSVPLITCEKNKYTEENLYYPKETTSWNKEEQLRNKYISPRINYLMKE